MTAAGDAVLAVALGEVGYVEGPNNSTKYWDWYGGNYGPWCGVFGMWCEEMAGYPPCTDYVLVSNGTVHSYTTPGSGATGVEAQRTLDLQPGDGIEFSWEPWEFRDGVPTCVGEWNGYPAGDHFGRFAYWVDQAAGRFAAVEGNTSDGSWDNGGMVMLREDRWTSQVCGWWRPAAIAGPGTPPQPEEPFTVGQYEDIMAQLAGITGTTNLLLTKVRKVRLVNAKGAQWLTDFINVVWVPSPDVVNQLTASGWLDNDTDAGGNAIPQDVSDALFATLSRLGTGGPP